MEMNNSFRKKGAAGQRKLSFFLEQMGAAVLSVLLLAGPFLLDAYKVMG